MELAQHSTISELNLHSIMVQLLWFKSCFNNNRYSFTFHYGSITMQTVSARELHKKVFTFHYGSITMLNHLLIDSTDNLFTFHYGSITINDNITTIPLTSTFTFHYGSITIQVRASLLML